MKDLSFQEATDLFARIAKGEMSDAELLTLLLSLKKKGETPDEIAGAASAFLAEAVNFPRPNVAFADCVGTGGDGLGTLNVSTAVMFVVAEMGLKMAKHGNVAVSSKCGSADVLKNAGVKIDMNPASARRCLDECDATFLFAPIYHTGMKHAAPVRKALGVRTIFNMLGPLINPSRPDIQLTGVYSEDLIKPYAQTLQKLGLQKGLVVHGSGLDEIAVHGPTKCCLIDGATRKEFEISPSDAGLSQFELEQILGGDPEYNRAALMDLLEGKGSDAYTSLVAINAGALFWTAGRCASLREGTALALETIRSGRSLMRLTNLAKMSHYD